MDREHLAGLSWEVKLIKLSDRIDNMESIASDPKVPADFRILYSQESKQLLDEALRGIESEMEGELDDLISKAQEK